MMRNVAIRILAVGLALTAASCSGADTQEETDPTPPPTTVATTTTTSTTTSSTTTTTTTTTTTLPPEVIAANQACLAFATLPFPARQAALEETATTASLSEDNLMSAMREECPEAIDDYEALAALAASSEPLNDTDRFDGMVGLACDPNVVLTITNPYDVTIGAIVHGHNGTPEDHDKSELIIIAAIEPGATAVAEATIVTTDGSCGAILQPYLVAPESDATDTWEPSPDAAPLPETTGDDWQAIVQAMLDAEVTIHNEGRYQELGATEDVRSKNYVDLTTNYEPSEWSFDTVTGICRVEEVTDNITAVVYTKATDEGAATLFGLFRKSPQDGHWRWLNTAIGLANDANCDILAGILITDG